MNHLEPSRTDRRLFRRRQTRRRSRGALLHERKAWSRTRDAPIPASTAIKAWKTAASAKYTYTSEPFALEQKDGEYIVTSRVTGDFPGSPVDLRFIFRLERGKIASLEITP